MLCRRQSSGSFAPASYSRTMPMICSSVNRLVRICPPPERRSNRFSLSVALFQGAGSDPIGVSDEVPDEYESYVTSIVSIMKHPHSDNIQLIEAYLHRVETENLK